MSASEETLAKVAKLIGVAGLHKNVSPYAESHTLFSVAWGVGGGTIGPYITEADLCGRILDAMANWMRPSVAHDGDGWIASVKIGDRHIIEQRGTRLSALLALIDALPEDVLELGRV